MILSPDPTIIASTIDRLRDHGWHPVLAAHGSKAAIAKGWTTKLPDTSEFVRYARKHGVSPNIGLRCDTPIVGIDLDEDDRQKAARLAGITREILGPTDLVRVGRVNRAMLFYASACAVSWSGKGVPLQIKTGSGHQAIAFGRHPDGVEYTWTGETPLDVPVDQLPFAKAEDIETLHTMIEAMTFKSTTIQARRFDTVPCNISRSPLPMTRQTFTSSNRLVDGRDEALRSLVWSAVQRCDPRKGYDPEAITDAVWMQFCQKADITVPKGSGRGLWSRDDARKKVRYFLASRTRLAAAEKARRSKGISLDDKLALLALVDRCREYTDAQRKAVVVMVDAMRDDRGICYMASGAIATAAGVHPKTAMEARQKALQLGHFLLVSAGRRDTRSRKGKPTVVRANLALLATPAEPSPIKRLQAFVPSNQNDQVGYSLAPEYLTTRSVGSASSPPRLVVVAGRDHPEDIKAVAVFRWPHLFYVDLIGSVRRNPGADPSEVAQALAELRVFAGVSQTELAQRAGTRQGSLSNIERGHDPAGDLMVMRLIDGLTAA